LLVLVVFAVALAGRLLVPALNGVNPVRGRRIMETAGEWGPLAIPVHLLTPRNAPIDLAFINTLSTDGTRDEIVLPVLPLPLRLVL
jgi:hypothetical protein